MSLPPEPGDLPPFPTEPHEFPVSGPGALASIPQRALARLLDTVVIAGVFIALFGVTGGDAGVEDGNVGADISIGLLLVSLLVSALYEVILTTLRGQTVGKMIVRIRVARTADGGNPLPNQALTRWLVPNVVSLIPFPQIAAIAVLVVYLSAAGHRLRQGFHDRAASTVVVRTR